MGLFGKDIEARLDGLWWRIGLSALGGGVVLIWILMEGRGTAGSAMGNVTLVLASTLAVLLPMLRPVAGAVLMVLAALLLFDIAWLAPGQAHGQMVLSEALTVIAGVYIGSVTAAWIAYDRHLGRVLPYLHQDVAEHRTPGPSDVEDITVLFVDLVGSTRFAEGVSPEHAALTVGDALGAVIGVLRTHNAVVDNVLGDGLLAYWRGPSGRQADQAIAAARAVVDFFATHLAGRLNQAGWSHPGIGIGINSGPAFVGDIIPLGQGPVARRHYTIIGDVVNVAARMEQATRDVGTPVLISERTAALALDAESLAPSGLIRIKGKPHPVLTFTFLEFSLPAGGRFLAAAHANVH